MSQEPSIKSSETIVKVNFLILGGFLLGGGLRADFREGDEDSNFSVFRVRRFTELPGPLH